jgi:hypothetical protein
MMKLGFQDYFFGSIFLAVFIALGYVILTAEATWVECEKRGGVVLETKNGHICAKVERI